MPRKRMIDPSLWADEGMAELTPRQQLLYIGLFSNADDAGRLKGSAQAIRLMLPGIYGAVSAAEVTADLAAVRAQMRQLVAYEHEGRQYLAFENYGRWQKIDRPSESMLPAPPEASHALREHSPTAHRALDEQSALIEGNRREEKLEEENGGVPAAAAAPPVSVPKEKSLPPAVVTAFTARGLTRYPQAKPELEAVRRLLRQGSADDLAECWQDHKTGDYGDHWAHDHLSFVMLERHNRFGNWLDWRDQGKPAQGQARASPRNGQLSRQDFDPAELARQVKEHFR